MSSEASDGVRVKEEVRQEWSGAAPGWRKWDTQLMAWTSAGTELIREAAQVKTGMEVLDLASGTGELALTLAAVVGPDGHVIATDLVPEMLAAAEQKARARGVPRIGFQYADAEALPFSDQRFDLVTCRWGVMHFPNPGQALREAYRVLRPGGRAVLVAWGPVEQNGFFAAMGGPFAKRGLLPPPAPGTPSPFQFARSGTLSAVMAAAGFQQVTEDVRPITMSWPGPVEQWMASLPDTSTTFRRLTESVPQEQLHEALAEVRALAQQHFDGQRVNFPVAVILATGVR